MKRLPHFEIVGVDPERIARTPPLASALQSFETSLFLVGLRRYPAALTACAGAVESTIRAVGNYKPSIDNDGLASAIKFALERKPTLKMPYLDDFRKTRNNFIHQGYSPEDDGKAVELLLSVGYPFLNKCLWEFHEVSLRDTVINGIWDQVEIAKAALGEMRTSVAPSSDVVDGHQISAIGALSHAIAIGFHNPANDQWTDVDYRLPDHEFTALQILKDKLVSIWNFHTQIKCPIATCADGWGCLVELDEGERNRLIPINLFCFDCRLCLRPEAKILIKHLVGASLKKNRRQILSEYGL